MSVRLKFALAVAALLAYVVAALVALLAGVRADLEVGDRTVLDRVLREEAALAAAAAVLFAIGLGVLVALAFRLYVIPPAAGGGGAADRRREPAPPCGGAPLGGAR